MFSEDSKIVNTRALPSVLNTANMAASEKFAAHRRNDAWEIDKVFFYSIDELTFMDEIKKYPVLYNHTINLHSRGPNAAAKVHAVRKIAKKFRGSTIMVNTRYASIRTKIGRYLKNYRPAGCVDDNFDVIPAFQPFSWIFANIKTRGGRDELAEQGLVSRSKVTTGRVSLPSPNLSAPHSNSDKDSTGLHIATAKSLTKKRRRREKYYDGENDTERVNALPAKKNRVLPTYRMKPTEFTDEAYFQRKPGPARGLASKGMQRLVVELLQQRKADSDSVMLFLRSVAPRIREIETSKQLQLQCELLQVIDRHCKLQAATTSAQLEGEGAVSVKLSPQSSPAPLVMSLRAAPTLRHSASPEMAPLVQTEPEIPTHHLSQTGVSLQSALSLPSST